MTGPLAPTNLQIMRDKFLFDATAAFSKGSSANIPDSQIFSYLNEAQDQIVALLKLPDRTAATMALVAGQFTYTLPQDLSAIEIRKIGVRARTYTGETGGEVIPLSPLSYDLASSVYDLTNLASLRTGTPSAYVIDPSNPRQIMLLPPPDYSNAGGVILDYTFRTRALSRIYNQSTITATATYLSPTIALSASPAAGLIRAGDQIGLIPTAQSDGTDAVALQVPPYEWYTVLSAATDTVTLSTPYDAPTSAAAAFIVAQVPELDQHYPGVINGALIKLALSYYFSVSSPQQSDRLASQAIAWCDQLTGTLPNERTVREQPAAFTNAFYYR